MLDAFTMKALAQARTRQRRQCTDTMGDLLMDKETGRRWSGCHHNWRCKALASSGAAEHRLLPRAPRWLLSETRSRQDPSVALGPLAGRGGSDCPMTNDVEMIKTAITRLSPSELRDLSIWYRQFEARLWDEQIEEDIRAGKLDKLADEGLADLAAGRCTDL